MSGVLRRDPQTPGAQGAPALSSRYPVALLGLTLGATLLLTTMACSSVLGLDRYEVEDSAGQGGTGAAGQGGTGAMGGSAAGGAGGTAGAFTNCDGITQPNLDVVRSCILRTSCSPFLQSVTISNCITWNYQSAFLGTSCTLAALDCDDIATCQGYGFAGADCAGQSGVRCEDNIAYDCNNDFFLDCATRGGTCVLYDSDGDSTNDSAGCKVADCFDPDGTEACDGNTYYTCIGGEGIGAACSAVQAECRSQGSQTGCFLKTRDTCTTTGLSCDGNKARLCTGDTLLELDCTSVGLECSDDPAGTYCAAAGCTPTQASACEESCNGSVMNLCYGGVNFPVDCQDYGFTRCAMLNDPSGGAPYAQCLL
ncbi:MAG: hypothetical protein KC766_27175 [Myxococcales bacterium]|nr:hypothetical protein [Myxococcales bacterium]